MSRKRRITIIAAASVLITAASWARGNLSVAVRPDHHGRRRHLS